jgi:hypothetical protein
VRCVSSEGIEAEQFHAVRLFARSRGSWQFAIHEQVTGLEHVVGSSALLRAWYDDDTVVKARNRAASMLEAAANDPDEPHYMKFLAKTYRVLQEPDQVKAWATRYVECIGRRNSMAAPAWGWIIEALLARGEVDAAKEELVAALKEHPLFPDLHELQVAVACLGWIQAVESNSRDYALTEVTSRGRVGAARRLLAEAGWEPQPELPPAHASVPREEVGR